jgi:hypothetical protein
MTWQACDLLYLEGYLGLVTHYAPGGGPPVRRLGVPPCAHPGCQTAAAVGGHMAAINLCRTRASWARGI